MTRAAILTAALLCAGCTIDARLSKRGEPIRWAVHAQLADLCDWSQTVAVCAHAWAAGVPDCGPGVEMPCRYVSAQTWTAPDAGPDTADDVALDVLEACEEFCMARCEAESSACVPVVGCETICEGSE